MPIPWLGMAGALGSAALGLGSGAAAGAINNEMQYNQQKKLMKLQIKGQKELGMFNQDLAYQMWLDTNYSAQREQMEKAGLNVGLMYGGQGHGGTTAGGQAGSVAGGQANPNAFGMGMQLALQASLQKAQIKNIEADTKVKEKEAEVKGQPTIENIEAETALKTANAEFQKLQNQITSKTMEQVMEGIKAATREAISNATKAAIEAGTAAQTQSAIIKQVQQGTTEQALRIATQKAGLVKLDADTNAVNAAIQKMSAEIVNMAANREIEWMKIDQNERERIVREKVLKLQTEQTEFNTSTPQQIRQWTGIITDIIGAMTGAGTGGGNSIGFKY